MSAPGEALAVTIAIVAAAATVMLTVLVALSAPQGTAPGASCQEWTDGCVVCSRKPEGIACSTPGIACSRGPFQCLSR
jgi:hypothetical protein